ncbi:disulfide bond formation protein B [Plastoroseomonas arctica]|uniref:Disulfide bond formation protein B n=1 Tax=Plastoroseomonas arctica TaxID=1509237 RepID=A0AAF1JUJ6_9PROT|nr:disulfide bond formation protein B [Plastoroseomonas arctica]MBR0654040.1 disulfide bond formation protein B [Plastoroseomonas arctica]
MPILLAVLAAAAPLFAMASESWGLAPCALCLWQRWPYWVAVVLAVLAALIPRARTPLLAGAILAILASGAIGVLHAGVEFGWWPSPLPSCRAANAGVAGASVEDLLRNMARTPDKPCDEPTFLIPGLPVSMAAMNVLYALALAAFGATFLRKGARP